VDCLDALASDRQYRRALPLDEAMAKVASEAGTAFDPAVVQALQARYQELEARARTSKAPAPPPLSVDIKITRGSAPAAGFETEAPAAITAQHPVAQARTNRRVQNESKRPDLPAPGLCSLQWEETLMVAARRIRRMISYDSIALWACEEDYVRVKFADGEERAELESLAVRQGEGLVGWVAEVGKPILNGNPAVEPGYAKEGGKAELSSALALPLTNAGRVVGVVALYRRERDAFAPDELVELLESCPALASLLLDSDGRDANQPDAEKPANNLVEMAAAIRRDSPSRVSK